MKAEPGGWWNLPPFTAEETARLARQRRRLRLLLTLAIAFLAALSVVSAVTSNTSASDGHRLSPWFVWLLALLPPTLLGIVAVVVDWRSQRPGPGLWLTAVAEPRSVQRVARQLQCGEPLAGWDRTLASACVARQRSSAVNLRWAYVLPTLLYLGGAVLVSSPVRWLFVSLFVLNGALIVIVPRGGKRLAEKAAAQGITAADPGPPWTPSTNESPEATS